MPFEWLKKTKAPSKLHPLWYSAYLPVFFFVSSIAAGMSMVIFEGTLSHKYMHGVMDEEYNRHHDVVVLGFARGCAFVLFVPHREILRAARSEDVDLIIMGASSGSIDHIDYKGYTGSTLQKVAKAAKCPVMTVHRETAGHRGGFSHVLFCTDFSKQSGHAFKYALSTAKECDCDLTMFHVDVGGKVLAQNEIEDRLIEARKRMRSLYGSQMGDFNNYEIKAWEGIPYMEIVKLARERMADLIIMAHNTRELDPDEARLGSTLEQVILRASCPVVSVNKPDKV